jgi:very-short-patch-repair endonuclease
LPAPTEELKFHPTRKWRFDLAFQDQQLAIEIDGAVFMQGRHSRGVGITKDCEKICEAVILGWRVMRVTTDMVKSGEALNLVERAYRALTVKEGC